MIKSIYTITDGATFPNFFCAFNMEAARLGRNVIRMYDEDDNEIFNSENVYNFLFKGKSARELIEDFIDHFNGDRHDIDRTINAGLIFTTGLHGSEWVCWSKKEILSGNYEFKNDAHSAIYEEGFFN